VLANHSNLKTPENRPRTLYVLERISPTHIRVGLERTAYLQEGILLRGEEGLNFTVGPVAPQPVDLRVQARDRLHLYRNPEQPGHLARDGMPAGISCTLPEALLSVKTGDRVYIDDGKIAASVVAVHEQYVALEITAPCGIPARIKSRQGVELSGFVAEFAGTHGAGPKGPAICRRASECGRPLIRPSSRRMCTIFVMP
jgi:pyruvate kinase